MLQKKIGKTSSQDSSKKVHGGKSMHGGKSASGDSFSERRRLVVEGMKRRKRQARAGRDRKDKEEFDIRIVSIRRVTKVNAGGKRLRMSVLVIVGDKKGSIGISLAKGRDVRGAQQKAVSRAKKKMVKISLRGNTIPHEIVQKYKAAKVFLKPAVPGTGVVAGGAVRAVVEVAGIKDILSKRLGSRNVITNVYATFEALKNLRLARFPKNGVK